MINIISEITGTVCAISIAPGTEVKKDEEIVVIESMKMEIPVMSPENGIIATVDVKVGDSVKEGNTVATLNPIL